MLKKYNNLLNIVSNAIIQGLIVYSLMLVIYKYIVEKKVDDYIINYIKMIYNVINGLFFEIQTGTNSFALTFKEDLKNKNIDINNEIRLYEKKQSQNNKKVIKEAFIILYIYLGLLAICIGLLIIFKGNPNWIGFLLGSLLTVLGTGYELYFITQVVLKYNFIKLVPIFDSVKDSIVDEIINPKTNSTIN